MKLSELIGSTLAIALIVGTPLWIPMLATIMR